MTATSETSFSNRELAEHICSAALDRKLSATESALNLRLAQVHATLALVDAIEALELPALSVTGSVLKGTCQVRPVRR